MCMKKIYGKYVVHQAAIKGKFNLIRHLHQQGNVLNKMDRNGETPILLAALKGHWDIVYFLHEKIESMKKKSNHYYDFFSRIM